jgi:hypothetical protein
MLVPLAGPAEEIAMSTRVVVGLAVAASMAAPILVTAQAPAAGRPAQASAAAKAPAYKVPMTPWGHPDLQGVWDYRSITPLERNPRYGDRQFYTDAEVKELEANAAKRMDEPPPEDGSATGTIHPTYWTDPGRFVEESRRTSLIVDPPNGRIPALTPEAQARQGAGGGRRGGGAAPAANAGGGGGRGAAPAANAGGGRGGGGQNRAGGRADSWLDRSSLERCITWGLPTAILPGLYNNNIEIVQSPTHVAITHEMVHDTRLIPLDGRPVPGKALAQWLGHSTARWEGETLVVETTNFNNRYPYRGAQNLKLTERFTRVGKDRVDFRLTVEDPTQWVQPWTAAFTMRTSEGPLVEYACHEGNYGLRNILEVARDEEKAAAEAAAQGRK